MEKGNLWKAIGLSFGVAVLGAVVWGVLYSEGWFVGLVAYFASFGMIKVFNKYYSKDCKWKYAYIFASIIILNIISSYIALTIYCADVWGVSFGVAFDVLMQVFSEFIGDFIVDMVMGCVCAVFGVITVVQIDKKNNANKKAMVQQQENASVQVSEQKEVEANEEKTETESKSVYCAACGSKLDENSVKCPSCGKDVE